MPFPYRDLNSPFLCLNKFSPEITYVCSHHCFLKWPHILFSWNHTLRCLIILWYTHSGLLNKTINADGEFFLVDCALKCCRAVIKSLLGHKYGFTGGRCVKSVILVLQQKHSRYGGKEILCNINTSTHSEKLKLKRSVGILQGVSLSRESQEQKKLLKPGRPSWHLLDCGA